VGESVVVGGLNSEMGVSLKVGEGVAVGKSNSLAGVRVTADPGVTLAEEELLQATRKRSDRSTLAFKIDLNKVNPAPEGEERIPLSI